MGTEKRPIVWDSVELIEGASEGGGVARRVLPDRRGRSLVKAIMSGASMKARGRRAPFTHVQLRRSLVGWPLFLYGWGLLGAVVASTGDSTLGVELVARVIKAAASQAPLPTVGRKTSRLPKGLTSIEKRRIDWDTVELVGGASGDGASVPQRVYPDRRGRSVVKALLAGASAKARGRGAIYTHVQIRRSLVGWQIFLYGWGLLGAAVASTRDFGLGVEQAARVIETAASQLAGVRPNDSSTSPQDGIPTV